MKNFGSITELFQMAFRQNGFQVIHEPNALTTYTADRTIQDPPGDASSIVVSDTATQTLTNKTLGSTNTLTGATASSFTNTGTVTLPTTTDTLVARATTDTLTNKSISGSTNTITNVSLTTGVTGTLPLGNGGTGQTTANSALNALLPSQGGHAGQVLSTNATNTSWITTLTNPMTTVGDIIYENATPAPARLPGNVSTTRQFLISLGDGVNATAPFWQNIQSGDLPSTSSNITSNVRASEGAGTTTLTNTDNRWQIFNLSAARTVVLPTTGVIVGDVWFLVNPNAFRLTVQASDASQIILAYGAWVQLTALINTPVTNADWKISARGIMYGASETSFTPVLSSGNVLNPTNSGSSWHREGEYLCFRGDINFSAGSAASGAATVDLPFGTVNTSDYPNGSVQPLGTNSFFQVGQGTFIGLTQWNGSNGPARIIFSNSWETDAHHIVSMTSPSFNTAGNFIGYSAKVKIDEFKWN